MYEPTPELRQALSAAAQQFGVSLEAVRTVFDALAAGGGRMAQFNHPDLGGMGQWSQGGMTQVGDMFNQKLKERVGALCATLAGQLQELAEGPLAPQAADAAQPGPVNEAEPGRPAAGDPVALIERLAGLRQKGVLPEAEFAAKKAALLGRL